MSARRGHRVLVVEDNPEEQADVCALLQSLGDSPRAVATVEEALTAIEEEEFCYFVLDQVLPLTASAGPLVTGGERVVRAARATDRRRTAEGDVTPILAFTSHSEAAPFLTGLFEIGISTFVTKPLIANMTYFRERLRGALTRAGRDDHARCAALARRGPPAASTQESTVRIAIDGKVTSTGRTAIEINGARRDMQDSKFVVILRCVVQRDRALDAWSSRDALGIGANRAATTLIREAFEGLVPDGFVVLEGDRRGNFRLNPAVAVTRVDWEALAQHPDPWIQRVAVERRKRLRGG